MKELIQNLQNLFDKIAKARLPAGRQGGLLDIEGLKKQEAELVVQMDDAQFWKRPDAQEVSKKREALRREIETWEKISSTVGEELDIARLAEAENNKELEGDIKKNMKN